MTFGDGPLNDLRLPLRWTVTFAVGAAIVIALALLLTDRRDSLDDSSYAPVRGGFDTALGPVSGGLAAPVRWTGSVFDYARDYWGAVDENRRLRRLASEGRAWRDAAVALREQNARLSALLRLRIEPAAASVGAHVVMDARGPFSQSRLIDAGREAGVRVGNPALSEHGLIGRVVGVAHGISRVLLLTDPISRVPVMIDRTDARAILAGDASDTPRLDYLRGATPVRSGDRVMTSGDGGLFPRGLPVGVVVRAGAGWRVRLFSDRSPISYARVLLYESFTGLADQPELNAPTSPRSLPPPPRPAVPAALPAPAPATPR